MTERHDLPHDVSNVLEDGKLFMFSLTYCGYCKMSAQVFDEFGCNYEYVEVDTIKGIQEK